ncbi:P-loop containing nucleoside triphosphate hydrolase protein [Mycena albidolilacea]|uniref:P-loop containing nucleoside triphosphate hydrolase protein n=1 Tax=Mycena albidolilacea TaxID=1033008 RepID=A0AAD6YYC6_9AGAR|nr:P-loop containing nucleoside triphosphate hydrolase protein [Mycena albidolilacea]
MAQKLHWRAPIGCSTIQKIVKKLIPAWKDGLRPVQEDLVFAILDGEDILCCTATGDGKSAAFSVPILALNEYNNNTSLYPAGLPTRLNPVGMVVTPTKGLAANIVLELIRLNITAFAYCRESLADACRRGVSLADEIKTCNKWQVICVDPEHLKTKEWREISEYDEVHLINLWGADFRHDFGMIGRWVRGHLPTTVSILGLTATLAPGKDTVAVCQSLGFFEGQFHLIRQTNERPNIQIILQTLMHGLAGYKFPDILPFLRSGRKLIIHFHSLDMLYRCYVYIWRLQPTSTNKMRRTRMYTSLCSAEYNKETIRLMDEDPEFQIILATIAFSNGINAKALLDSLTLGASASVDIMVQEKGRAGRVEGTLARGIVFVQKSTITLANKTIAAASQPAPLRPQKGKGSRKHKAPDPMGLIKAKFLTELYCYVAFLNIHFQNPPILTSWLDCLTAKRLLPCSLCLARSGQSLNFPAPLSTHSFPALISPSPSKARSGCSRKLMLTCDERETATLPFTKFCDAIRLEEHRKGKFLEHPRAMFLPSSIVTSLLDNLLLIDSPDAMVKMPLVQSWRHSGTHSASLYRVLLKAQSKIRVRCQVDRDAKNKASRQKRAATKRMKRKAAELSDSMEEEGENGDEEDEVIEDFPAERLCLGLSKAGVLLITWIDEWNAAVQATTTNRNPHPCSPGCTSLDVPTSIHAF